MRARCAPVSNAARITEESEPLPQFSLFDLSDEPDELTVRRDFSPKSPPRVAVDVSDADATWKWQPPRADAQGKFAGLALPLLDGKQALEFDPSEVEVTREMVSPFAMREVPKAMELRRRARPRVVAKPVRRGNTSVIALCAVLAVALVAAIAFVVRRPRAQVPAGPQRMPVVETPVLELPAIPAPSTGATAPAH